MYQQLWDKTALVHSSFLFWCFLNHFIYMKIHEKLSRYKSKNYVTCRYFPAQINKRYKTVANNL